MLNTLKFIANHPLTAKHPIQAFLRYGNWQIKSRLRREVIVNWIEGSKLVVQNGMTGATGNIYCGLQEFADMGFVLHMLRPGDLFVDIGANIGSYTVLASKVCGARSISVEPDPDTIIALRRNISINKIENLVRSEETALGSKSGTVHFTIGRDTVNQVVQQSGADVREVRLTMLDTLIEGEDPFLIKMDVEGFEAEVLKGAKVTLSKPSLLAIETETADSSVTSQIEDAGFERRFYVK